MTMKLFKCIWAKAYVNFRLHLYKDAFKLQQTEKNLFNWLDLFGEHECILAILELYYNSCLK